MPSTRRDQRAAHNAAMRRVRARRRSAGLCDCGKPREVRAKCLDCWFSRLACHHAGSWKHGDDLRRIWDQQDGRCYWTGELLVPGSNASVDHLVPKSRGGRDEPSNLVWTTKTANRSKSDMTPEEFVRLCRLIVHRHRKAA